MMYVLPLLKIMTFTEIFKYKIYNTRDTRLLRINLWNKYLTICWHMDAFQIIIYLIGGLGLFLFGMEQLSSGMKRLAGRKMRHILDRFTATKGGGVVFG